MAYYAALVSLVQLLKDIMNHDHPYSDYVLDKQQLHLSLYEKFNLLQELLDDYSPKDHKEESADLLKSRIRDAACDAQDIIESHVSDLFSEEQIEDLEKVKTNVGFTVEELMTIKNSHTTREEDLQNKYYEELEKVKAEVDTIVEEMVRIKMESLTTEEEGLQRSSYISADNFGGAPKVEAQIGISSMVVFDEEFMITIKSQLCGEPSALEVVSIVGMGGLGKTTLARNIFNDKLIHDHFDCRAWVTVSQDYHMPKVLQDIANSMNIAEKEGLAEDIRKHLFGRRYLIVIDDIWDIKIWNDIKRIFPDTIDRSRIMFTTRLYNVALYAGNPNFLHEMQFLDEDQSWILLQQKVFAHEHCPEELEAIGKLIAKNCRGLPLGIVVIAGVLSNVNVTQHDWEEIARNVSSIAIVQNDKHLSKILFLSYNHLPHHLKPCFLHLGGFPEDYEISISKLIKLWVAEGFLKPIESKSLEEIGEEYLKDLVNRNLVLITKKTSTGKFKYCIIHDLLRDLCSQRAQCQKFLHHIHERDDVDQESIGNVRRLCIQMWDDSLFLKYMAKHVSHIRSVMSFARVLDEDHFLLVASDCKLLRILDTTDMTYSLVPNFTKKMEENYRFPNEILELFHLRYLAVRVSEIRIPPSIFQLQNLQTLIIHGAGISLPSEIWMMSHLRHVVCWTVTFPPLSYDDIRRCDGIPLLGKLQTLSKVVNFGFTRDTVEIMPSLQKLKVKYNCGENWEQFGLNNLVYLHQLEILEICFSSIDWTKLVAPLPDNFPIPSNLIKLSVEGCSLSWKDMTIVGSMPNLQVLKLKFQSFVGKEWEPIEGEFLKLKFLLMEQLYDLKYLIAENIHFPCLEQLHIRFCKNLKEIPSGIGDISSLQLIEVWEDGDSVLGSLALKIQEEQRDQGNDDLQVHVVSQRKDPKSKQPKRTWSFEDDDDLEEINRIYAL